MLQSIFSPNLLYRDPQILNIKINRCPQKWRRGVGVPESKLLVQQVSKRAEKFLRKWTLNFYYCSKIVVQISEPYTMIFEKNLLRASEIGSDLDIILSRI